MLSRIGPYEILDRIGAGGMGEVYRARDTRLGRMVAIKVLASTFRNLNHPHICTVQDLGHQDGIDFLVMEFLEGETLAARAARGAIPPSEALRIARVWSTAT